MYKPNRSFYLSLALLAGFFAAPSTSRAQSDSVRLHLTLPIGVGGEVAVDVDEEGFEELPDADMETTFGAAAGIEIPVVSLFTIGAEVGFSFWNTEPRADPPAGGQEFDRHRQLDLLARPKLRFEPVKGLELYGVVPVGLTYFIPSPDSDTSVNGIDIEAEGGIGVAVGFGAGLTYFLHENIGLTAEVGYLYRRANASVRGNDGFESVEIDEIISFGQTQLRAGIAFAF